MKKISRKGEGTMTATLRHLQIFSEVAQCGKMSLAAERLFLSQSTVSQAISELEGYYNVLLFERLSKRLHLTPKGEELLIYARRILTLTEDMDSYFKHSAKRADLRIGASVTTDTYIMYTLAKQFRNIMPQIDMRVCVFSSPQIKAKVLSNELDIALTAGSITNPDLIVRPVISDELVFVCGREHPFFGRSQVTLSDLADQEYVLRESTSATRKIFDSFIEKHNIPIRISWVCNNTEAVKLAVEGNCGITLISRSLIKKECADQRLHPFSIEGQSFQRPLSLIYHKDKYLGPAAEEFIRLCSQFKEMEDL